MGVKKMEGVKIVKNTERECRGSAASRKNNFSTYQNWGGGENIFDQKKVPAMLNIFLKENARHLTLKKAELCTYKNG